MSCQSGVTGVGWTRCRFHSALSWGYDVGPGRRTDEGW